MNDCGTEEAVRGTTLHSMACFFDRTKLGFGLCKDKEVVDLKFVERCGNNQVTRVDGRGCTNLSEWWGTHDEE